MIEREGEGKEKASKDSYWVLRNSARKFYKSAYLGRQHFHSLPKSLVHKKSL